MFGGDLVADGGGRQQACLDDPTERPYARQMPRCHQHWHIKGGGGTSRRRGHQNIRGCVKVEDRWCGAALLAPVSATV